MQLARYTSGQTYSKCGLSSSDISNCWLFAHRTFGSQPEREPARSCLPSFAPFVFLTDCIWYSIPLGAVRLTVMCAYLLLSITECYSRWFHAKGYCFCALPPVITCDNLRQESRDPQLHCREYGEPEIWDPVLTAKVEWLPWRAAKATWSSFPTAEVSDLSGFLSWVATAECHHWLN